MNFFKAYDIRGVYGVDITEDVAYEVGRALGTWLEGDKDVCVGHDTRKSSPGLTKRLCSGLISTGCNVISLGLVTNPVAYFHAWNNKIFGCYVTASHNPADWNGIKIFKPNGVSLIEETEEVRDILISKKFLSGNGSIREYPKAVKDYSNFLKKRFDRLDSKIVVDFLGGAGASSIQVLRDLGLDVISLNEQPNAELYGFHKLVPLGGLLEGVKETVKKEEADFGVAYDCDTDRSIFIGPDGSRINPSVMNLLFIRHILEKEGGGKVICTYDCASELEKMTNEMGGKLIWNRVGHGFIEQRCVEEGALFAGEQSSHFYFNQFYPFSDGILSTIMLSSIVKETGKGVKDLIDPIKLNPVEKIYVPAGSDEKKDTVVEELKKRFPDSIDIVDGFKMMLNDVEWVMIRSSQTLPEINVCAEGENEKRVKEIIDEYSELVKKKLRETP